MVVLDSYPNLQIAASWFEHRPDELVENLESRGFTVERGAWSRHTFTSLSVPSILQLGSVIEPGPTGHWNDRSSLWRILRGDNFVSQTLGSAGFTYTHIESGWAGTSCGPEVDRCIPSPWIDEQVWLMLQPTIAGRWADQRHHFLTGTMNTAESLKTGLEALTGNGKHDYLFAHFLLPHEPILVDAQCRPLRDPLEQGNDPTTRAAAIGDQMECVDKLVMSAIDAVDDDTAVLLTADHGSGISNQVGRPPDEWSDAGIAERFSVFLSHKIPAPCESPDLADPMSAMAAIVGCAVGQEFPLAGPEYLIGAEDPVAVEPERMARIKQEVANGTLAPQISQGLPESSEGTHQGETLSP
jgi:hypothetical protein